MKLLWILILFLQYCATNNLRTQEDPIFPDGNYEHSLVLKKPGLSFWGVYTLHRTPNIKSSLTALSPLGTRLFLIQKSEKEGLKAQFESLDIPPKAKAYIPLVFDLINEVFLTKKSEVLFSEDGKAYRDIYFFFQKIHIVFDTQDPHLNNVKAIFLSHGSDQAEILLHKFHPEGAHTP